MSWVVVRMLTERCETDPTTRCIMNAVGPFTTADEAQEVAALQPEWTNAHVVALIPD